MEREYRMGRQINLLFVVCGILGLGMGIASLALPVFDDGRRTFGTTVFVLLTGPLYLAGGVYCLRIVLRGAEYGLALGPNGFRRLSDGPGSAVSWSRVARLRERRMLHRVELLDHVGTVLARVEYQIEGFEDAMATILASTDYQRRLTQLPSRVEAGASRVVWLLMLGLIAFTFVFAGSVPGLILLAVMAFPYWKDRRVTRQGLVLEGAGVRLTTKVGSVTIPGDQIEDVRVVRKPVGNGAYLLDVALLTRDGSVHLARPGFADPFVVWAMLRALQQQSRTSADLPPAMPVHALGPSPIPARRRASGVVAAMSVVGLLCLGAYFLDTVPDSPVDIGSRLPNFAARELLTGRHVSPVARGRGRVMILSFWHHECEYCRSQLLALDSVRQRVDSSRVRVVAVHLEDEREAAATVVRDLVLGIELWEDVEGAAYTRFQFDGTPATLIVDRAGCIRFSVIGTGGVEVERLVRAVESVDRGPALASCVEAAPVQPPADSTVGPPSPAHARATAGPSLATLLTDILTGPSVGPT